MTRGAATVPVVVLTGGIASGKTMVSDRFEKLGVPIIDTDRISREVVRPGTPGLASVVHAFGPRVLETSGSLDRKALRDIVFKDPEDRERLESILHPLIESEVQRQIQSISGAAYCLLVVPLFVETGLFDDAELVVTVDVDEDTQRRRLIERDAIPDETVEQILNAQVGRADRLARADVILDNTGSAANLFNQVDRLHAELLQRFGQRS